MSIGADLQGSVVGFLADLGRPMVLRRIVPGTYSDATGQTVGDTHADYTGRGRLGDYSDKDINGTVIKQADRRVTFLPDDRSIVPQAGDRLGVPDFNGDLYTIESFKMREVGGVLVAFTLQVTR